MQIPFFPARRATAAALVLAACGAAGAATLPDLQAPAAPQPPAAPDPALVPGAPPAATPAATAGASAAGLQVDLQRVEFSGNRTLSSDELAQALGPVTGRRHDLASLQALAQQVAALYRARGYPFVRAVLPPQRLDGGVLRIEVVEGVLGTATASGPDPLAGGAQAFVAAGLPRGEVLRAQALERVLLLANDQPGFRVRPTLRPGAQPGESDLDVAVERRSRVSGELALDNGGNQATGTHRARALLGIDSPFRYGDRITLSALATDEGLWLGSADYETPLGATGWRGLAGVSRSSYQLGAGFAALDASGTADTVQLRLSNAVLRSQAANLTGTFTLQSKRLRDSFLGGALVRDKSSRLAIASLQFDRRDGLLGGGVSYGQASLTAGHLALDGASAVADAATAQAAGGFTKWNLDVARIQALSGPWSAYGRVSVQGTGGNLDSSEKYAVGGMLGVRAYPLGEATGDKARLLQLELRHATTAQLTLFGFADAGHARGQARPWDAGSAAQRSIAGAGLGLRWLQGPWRLESTLGWRTHGGAPQAESRDRDPRLFLVLTRSFSR